MRIQCGSRRNAQSNATRHRRQWTASCLAAALFACTSSVSLGDLTHRYSFNDGTANDRVGVANGTLVNGATVSGGRLVLANDGSSNTPATGRYVDLPNNIARTRNVTVEGWTTWNGGGDWQWVTAIGTTTIGEILPGSNATGYEGTEFFGVTPRTDGFYQSSFGGGINRFGNAASVFETGRAMPTGSEQHFALVIQGDPNGDANGANGSVSLYRNGTPIGTVASQYDPALFSQVNTWIGRSLFQASPFYAGSVNEFRIYDEALSAGQVAASYRLGPNEIVPEPGAGLAALSLGALALMRRRANQRGG